MVELSLEEKIAKIKNAQVAIKTAIENKGGIPSGNIETYADAISNLVVYNNETLDTITQNGTYRHGASYTGFDDFTVSIPLQSLTINPSTSSQTITHSNHGGYNNITVNPVTSSIDNNCIASNIRQGSSILGVNGSVVELKGETRSVSITSTVGNTFTPNSEKNGITSITVTPTNQAKTITPTTSSQSISVPSGYSGFGALTVNAVTSAIDSNIVASNIKQGKSILGVNGSVIELNGQTKTVTPTTMQQAITPDSPKNGLTYVVVEAVTSAIDQNILPENIKQGISILGIVGNYTGGSGSEGLKIEMLSNGTLGGNFFAIGGSDNDLWKMFDGDEYSYYVNINPFDFTFYSPIKLFLSAIKVISSGGFSIEEDVMIEGSIDNFNYSKLDYAGTLYEDGIISFLNPNPYKYYRFISFSSGKRNISEIQMIGTFVS